MAKVRRRKWSQGCQHTPWEAKAGGAASLGYRVGRCQEDKEVGRGGEGETRGGGCHAIPLGQGKELPHAAFWKPLEPSTTDDQQDRN